MNPLIALTRKIDDIEMYFEIYAKNDLAKNFDRIFSDGRFSEKADNVLVMLHGNGEDRSVFYNNIEAFCDKNICVLVDSRAHGKTSFGSQELSIDLMSEDISKLCDELNIGKFKLLGFSDGGNIALTYAIRHPERLSHLIVSGANLNPSGLKFSTKLSIYLKHFFAKSKRHMSDEAKSKYELLNLMAEHPHISPRLLRNIDCKTLVMEGRRDVIKSSHTLLIAKTIKSAKHEIVPDSGHNVFCDNPQYVNELILQFLE